MLDLLPLWAIYGLTVLFALASVELGHWVGKAAQRRAPEEKESLVGALAGATLGLLAFLLAFTTGVAVNRFDNRRQLVVSEVNAIGTTSLRAGYLDEPHRQEVRGLLRTYVDVRLAAVGLQDLSQELAQAEEIHAALWAHAERLARAQPESEMVGLFIVSLNEMIDLHTVRYVAVTATRIPPTLWYGLFAVTFLAMLLVGIQTGYGLRRNNLALLVLALVFSAVILLIVDLDSAQKGALNVSQQPMIDLQRQLQRSTP